MDQLNSLPDHIFIEVFGNLSPRMIKCCALVCKRWNEIIGSSIELMERFKIDISCRSYGKFEKGDKVQRKYQAAKIRSIEESLDFLSGQNLQSLTISYPIKTKLSLLVDTLNNLRSLRYLKITDSFFNEDLPKNSLKKSKNNLIELSCDLKIMHIFDCITVEKFRLDWCEVDEYIKMQFIDFLKKQKNLQDLKIQDYYGGELFTFPDLLDVKLPLKKFKYFCRPEPLPHYSEFIKFLNHHKNSLTSLKLQFCTEPKIGIEFIHKFALENIVNLKHLELGYFKDEDDDGDVDFNYELKGEELTYDQLISATDITRNLESIAIRARSTDMNENRRFYGMIKNIKHLKLNFVISHNIELLHCVHEIFVNLETLHLCNLNRKIPEKIYFPKLKEFSVGLITGEYRNEKYRNEKYLCNFIRRHSQTLEKIDIEVYEDNRVNFVIEEMRYCPNLTYLKAKYIEHDNTILETLDDVIRRAKSLTLIIPTLESEDKFEFPDDKAIWDQACNKVYRSWSY